MAFDPADLSRWKARLKAAHSQSADTDRPVAPAEGLLATCRLSDEVRTFALAGVRYQHPTASPAELEIMLYEFRLKWEDMARRIRIVDRSSVHKQ
jgi:hypothetical protein